MSADFTFQENIDSFIGERADKEYWLKISSKDTVCNSPFDFNVKFNIFNLTFRSGNLSQRPNNLLLHAGILT